MIHVIASIYVKEGKMPADIPTQLKSILEKVSIKVLKEMPYI
jgi:hypothetical protein